MKRLFLLLTLSLLPLAAGAQTTQEEFLRRYNNLIDHVGADGLGVETLLDKWEEAFPDDYHTMLARFSFCFARSRTARVIQLDRDRYLGESPILPMKDSLGRRCNWFQDYEYDDDLFAAALLAVDRAIDAQPLRLDFRTLRITALMAYEKEAPDMTLAALKGLADKHFKTHPAWQYEGLDTVGDEQFKAFMQDYCAALFRLGSDASAEAFKAFSEHLLRYCKDEPMYLDNLGSYYLIKKDYKKALKYFEQVLKKHPDDRTALQNGILLARAKQDPKLEKKFRERLAETSL